MVGRASCSIQRSTVLVAFVRRAKRRALKGKRRWNPKPTSRAHSESKYITRVRLLQPWGLFPKTPKMIERFASLKIACVAWALAGTACAVNAQTYQIGPDASKSPQAKQNQPAKKQQKQQGSSLGWGTNIQNARIARAAVMALQKGQKAQALDLARKAVKSAPNDPKLWFLLGYAARLNNRLPESEDAYHHGLSLDPNSLDGTSGLAQDLSISGRTGEAI